MRKLGPVHIVQALAPADQAGGDKTSRVISLKNYEHVTVILNFGITGAAADGVINFYGCTNVAKSNNHALDTVTFRRAVTAMATSSDLATDTWSTLRTITGSDLHISDMADSDALNPNDSDAGNICNGIVVVEFDAVDIEQATSGDSYIRDCFYFVLTNPTASVFLGATFILQPRYQREIPLTAIAN